MKRYASVYYYDIYKTPTDNRYKNTEEIFNELFPLCGTFNFKDINNKEYIFDILEKTNEYIFGRLGREDTYRESLTILKHKDNGQPMNMENIVFEKFTFFYIDLIKNRLSLIKNRNLGDFREYFLQFIIS